MAGTADSAPESSARRAPPATLTRVLVAAAITTAAVTVLSYRAGRYAATAVGLSFLAATWFLVLRYDEETILRYGLSLGGVLEPVPLEPRRALRDALRALSWALAVSAVVFPPFWFGFRAYWGARRSFVYVPPESVVDELAGQVLVIALPEEAFFRGYLQTALDEVWPPGWRILGARLGPGWLVSAAIFAVGHFLTTPHPSRLAVFFPALAFGWLRAKTGGIGAGVVFHAACNVLSATLGRGYGLG